MDTEVADAGGCRVVAVGVGLGGGKEDAVLDVGVHLPEVGWVGFLDIDDVETGTIPVGIVELVERGNLPAKWRSSVAAENEDDGFSAEFGGKFYDGLVGDGGQFKIRRGVADLQGSGAGAHPKRLKRQDHERNARDVGHDGTEAVRGLDHDAVHCGAEEGVDAGQRGQGSREEFHWLHLLISSRGYE